MTPAINKQYFCRGGATRSLEIKSQFLWLTLNNISLSVSIIDVSKLIEEKEMCAIYVTIEEKVEHMYMCVQHI